MDFPYGGGGGKIEATVTDRQIAEDRAACSFKEQLDGVLKFVVCCTRAASRIAEQSCRRACRTQWSGGEHRVKCSAYRNRSWSGYQSQRSPPESRLGSGYSRTDAEPLEACTGQMGR